MHPIDTGCVLLYRVHTGFWVGVGNINSWGLVFTGRMHFRMPPLGRYEGMASPPDEEDLTFIGIFLVAISHSIVKSLPFFYEFLRSSSSLVHLVMSVINSMYHAAGRLCAHYVSIQSTYKHCHCAWLVYCSFVCTLLREQHVGSLFLFGGCKSILE